MFDEETATGPNTVDLGKDHRYALIGDHQSPDGIFFMHKRKKDNGVALHLISLSFTILRGALRKPGMLIVLIR